MTADVAPPAPSPLPSGPDEDAERTALQLAALRLRTARMPAPTVHYAGFVIRALAMLIDLLVLAIFTVPLTTAGLLGVKLGAQTLGIDVPLGVEEPLALIVLGGFGVMALVYFSALHAGDGQTIGKAVAGVRVRTIDLDPLGGGRSVFRTLCYLTSSSFGGLGFLIAAFMPRKRAWHDFLARTCVVHASEEP